mmetsp:Transcript_5229/g.6392  ORF Transcript_5229/g.6392 Transcript_5229/m.6392 type:complete len:456 (-) Transcript_5229:431-1798(-)
MKKCVSMLEFGDVRELHQIDDALRKLALIDDEKEYEEKKDSNFVESRPEWKADKGTFDDEGWKRKESGNHDRGSLDFSDSPCRMNLSRGFEIQEPNLSDMNTMHTRSMKKSASFHCPSMEMASPEATMTKSPSFLGGTSDDLNGGDDDDDFFYGDISDDDDYGQYDAPVMFDDDKYDAPVNFGAETLDTPVNFGDEHREEEKSSSISFREMEYPETPAFGTYQPPSQSSPVLRAPNGILNKMKRSLSVVHFSSSSDDGLKSVSESTLPPQYGTMHPSLKPAPKKSGMKKTLSFLNFKLAEEPKIYAHKQNRSNPELHEKKDPEFKEKMKRNVSFSDIKITEFDMTLGDNPCCRFGPPVQLAWESSGEENYNIDVYEEFRIPRSKEQLVMPSDLRMRLLATDAGYSLQELREAIKQGNKTKRQRQWTVSTLALSQLENVAESSSRKIKRQLQKGDI